MAYPRGGHLFAGKRTYLLYVELGLKELRQEICHYLKRRQRLEYDPNTEVMVTVGGSEAIDIALRAMLNPGDEVLIPQPSYVSYVPCTVLAGGTPVIIELEEKG